MTTNIKEISSIIEELEKAASTYYNGEEPIMTDEEFDTKQEYLENHLIELKQETSLKERVIHIIGAGQVALGGKIAVSKEIKHAYPMLSLAKAKTNEELKKFLEKAKSTGATAFSLQLKLDGFAMSANYEDGILKTLATRGDGEVGEDVSYLATAKDVVVLGLPQIIGIKEKIEVRGELFLSEAQFKAVNKLRFEKTQTEFKNSRNAVVGLMKKAEKGVDYQVDFTFATYSIYKDGALVNFDTKVYSSQFVGVDELTQWCIEDSNDNFPIAGIETIEEAINSVNKFGVIRENGFEYPTDGVVIKPSNEAFMQKKMGNTSHHPASQIAYKYPAPIGESRIIDIILSVGKTGKVTPRAVIEPVDLMGTVIRNVSLHNFDWMNERHIRINSKVAVTRANDVIPYIKSVIINPDDSYEITAPTTCPSCAGALLSEDGVWPPKTLRCNNFECPSRDIFSLRSAVGKNYLNIDGMSEVSIDSLNEEGILTDISDLYLLDLKTLANSTLGYSSSGNPRRLGEKRAQNILDHIEKSKTLPLYKLLASLSIQGLGPTIAKDLIRTFKTFENIKKATIDEISNIDGFGAIRAKQISDGLNQKSKLISRLITSGVEFEKEVVENNSTASKLAGKSFAISGPVPAGYGNRNSWIEWLETQGAEFHSSPKDTTTYMIADAEGSSSKVKKARELGITFILAEDFNTLI